MDIWGVSPMELRMVLKSVQLYTMGTLSVGSASRSQLGLSAPTLRASHSATATGWSFGVLGALLLQPTTCTKIVFIYTFMTFLALCWAFSQWMRHAAFTTCLTWATLGSVVIAFPEIEWLDLIYGCCCCNSTIGFVLVEVLLSSHAPWHVGGGLDTWHPLSSSFIWPTFWLQNVLLHEKATLPYVPFSHLQFGTGIFLPDLWYVDLAGQLTCVLFVWCHYTSHWCGSSMMYTLLGCLQ